MYPEKKNLSESVYYRLKNIALTKQRSNLQMLKTDQD